LRPPPPQSLKGVAPPAPTRNLFLPLRLGYNTRTLAQSSESLGPIVVKSQLRIVVAVLFCAFCAWTFIALPAGLTWLAIELHAYGTAPASPEVATNQTVPLRVCRPHGGPCQTVYVTELAATTHTIANVIFLSWLVAAIIGVVLTLPLGIRAQWAKTRKSSV
jgi:hypothetical protein